MKIKHLILVIQFILNYTLIEASIWKQLTVGSGTGNMGTIAIGKGRNDGVNRVYGSNSDYYVYEFSWSGSNWIKSSVGNCGNITKGVVLGEGRNDGINRIYAASWDYKVYEFSWDDSSWIKVAVGVHPGLLPFNYITIGDGRNDGKNRLYTTTLVYNIYEFSWNGVDWDRYAINFSTETNTESTGVTVGNGRNDGVNRVYISCGNDHIYELTWTGVTWDKVDMGMVDGPGGIILGDAKSSGINSVYVASWDKYIYEFNWEGSSWTKTAVGFGETMRSVGIGDGRNSGEEKIYGGGNVQMQEFSWDDNNWTGGQTIGTCSGGITDSTVLSVNVVNGRNDGINRVYFTGGDKNIYELTYDTLTYRIDRNNSHSIYFNHSSGEVILNIPVEAFSNTVDLTISSLEYIPSASNTPRLRPTLIAIEISLTPLSVAIFNPVTISMSYRDSDIVGLNENNLGICYFDEIRNEWQEIESFTAFPTQNKVVGSINHFTKFQIMEILPKKLVNAYVYPNPYKPSLGHSVITFKNLTIDADIKIFNIAGEKVKTLKNSGIDDKESWDVTNDKGNTVASGIYIYVISDKQGYKKTGKLAIIR